MRQLKYLSLVTNVSNFLVENQNQPLNYVHMKSNIPFHEQVHFIHCCQRNYQIQIYTWLRLWERTGIEYTICSCCSFYLVLQSLNLKSIIIYNIYSSSPFGCLAQPFRLVFPQLSKYQKKKLLDKSLACTCFLTSASMDTIAAFCVQILGSIYHIPSRTCISRSIQVSIKK